MRLQLARKLGFHLQLTGSGVKAMRTMALHINSVVSVWMRTRFDLIMATCMPTVWTFLPGDGRFQSLSEPFALEFPSGLQK
jgi:hypothetical protein